MKKIAIIILSVIMLMLSGCTSFSGYDWIDTEYHYDYAVIRMPDDEIKTVYILKWSDSEDGEQLTITAVDGTVYLVSSINCVLVKEKY